MSESPLRNASICLATPPPTVASTTASTYSAMFSAVIATSAPPGLSSNASSPGSVNVIQRSSIAAPPTVTEGKSAPAFFNASIRRAAVESCVSVRPSSGSISERSANASVRPVMARKNAGLRPRSSSRPSWSALPTTRPRRRNRSPRVSLPGEPGGATSYALELTGAGNKPCGAFTYLMSLPVPSALGTSLHAPSARCVSSLESKV
eukprot:30497-Pelagococcus_subviridis.AAC.17